MIRLTTLSTALCLSVAVSACGGSTRDAPSERAITEASFPTYFAESLCRSMAGCCRRVGLPHDDAACAREMVPYLQSDLLAYEGVPVEFDAAAARRCTEAAVNVLTACEGDFWLQIEPIYQESLARPGFCWDLFPGQVPLGGACTTGAGTECRRENGEIVDCLPADGGRVCERRGQLPVPAVEGEPCVMTCTTETRGLSCGVGPPGNPAAEGACFTNDGLACNVDGHCGPLPPTGAPCATDCSTEAYCKDGTCVVRPDSGPCQGSYACSEATYCGGSGACLPRKADGEACENPEECLSGNCLAQRCGPIVPVTPALCAGDL